MGLLTSSREALLFPSRDSLTSFMMERWGEISSRAVKRKGRADVALSGGRTPVDVYRKVAEMGRTIPWDKIHIFLADERFVPPDHEDSNYRMIRDTIISRVTIPEENVHAIPTDGCDPETSARQYEEAIRFFRLDAGQYPSFDLIVLGLGVDGHTASLFPGNNAVHETARLAAAVRRNDGSHDRITLTIPVLNSAAHLIFLVTGEEKAAILRRVVETRDISLPAALVDPGRGDVLFLIDEEAGALLSRDRFSRTRQ